MSSAKQQFDLHVEADRIALTNALEAIGIRLPPLAFETAERELSDDGLMISPSMGCRLDIGSAEQVVSWPYWAEIICALYTLRTHTGLAEQVRRLRLPNHEKLDTALVVAIAGRYLGEGYSVEFEPNGNAGSDLLISGSKARLYLEVKRENWRDQRRSLDIMQRADEVREAVATALKDKLDASGTRVEIHFAKLFSKETIPAICAEVTDVYQSRQSAHEVPLHTIGGSRMIVMPRGECLHFDTGLISWNLRVPPKSTIQLGQHLAVTAGFKFTPNFSALANNVRKAFTQLEHDLAKDPLAQGMIIAEMMAPREACDEIRKRFPHRLSPAILGVVVIGRGFCMVHRTDLTEEELAIMKIAARPTQGTQQGGMNLQPDDSVSLIPEQANRIGPNPCSSVTTSGI